MNDADYSFKRQMTQKRKKKNDTEDDKDNKKKRIKLTKYTLYPQDIHNNIAITGLSLSFPYAPFSIDSLFFKPILALLSISISLKISQNQRFSGVFRGYRNGALGYRLKTAIFSRKKNYRFFNKVIKYTL